MIPENYRIESAEKDDRGSIARINLRLFDPATGRQATCGMTLKEGSSFRGMKLDDRSIAVKILGGLIKLIELDHPLQDAVQAGAAVRYGNVLLEVRNPLKQNIMAVLRHDPLVKLERAYNSQLFLEMVHGFAPSP